MVVLSRLLAPHDFGLLAIVAAVTGLALVLSDFGLSMAYIQAESVSEQERSNLFWLNSLIGIVAFFTIISISSALADFYNDERIAAVAQSLASVFLLSSVTAQHRADLSRRLEFSKLAACDIVAAALGTAVAITLALNGSGYWSLVWQQLATAIATSVQLILMVRWRPLRPRNFGNIKRFLRYGINTTLVQLLNYFTSNVDSLLIGKRWGSTELGYYDRAFQLFKVPLNQIAAPMTKVAVPVLSRSADAHDFIRIMQAGRLFIVFTVGALFLFVSANSAAVVHVVFGEQWAQSSAPLAALAVGGFFQALSYPYFWAFLAKSKTGLQLKFSVATKLFSIGLMVVGMSWGMLGVAWGLAIGNALNWLVLTVFAMPLLSIPSRQLLRSILIPISLISVPAAASFLAGCLVPSSSHVLSIILSVLVYALWIGLILALSKRSRDIARSIIAKVKARLRKSGKS